MTTPRLRECCFLIPGDWHTPTGGYTYDRRLVQGLREAGWTVDVRSLHGGWPWPDDEALAAARASVEAIDDGTLVVADGLAFGVLQDLAQAHARRLRWVALVHHPLHMETGLDDASRLRLRAGEAQALQHARRVVVTSPSTAQDVAALGVALDRIAVVEPGTDPVLQARAIEGRGEGRSSGRTGPVRLLCVATLTPRKGHAVLLEALAGLGSPGTPGLRDWELHNVGSLTRDPDTAARVQDLGRQPALAGRVFWHGEVSDEALKAHYAAADLVVQPSLHEGYGMAVAEALAHGLPVLASRAGALAQTLPADAGLLVPPNDAEALGTALARLLAEPELCARLAAGARAASLCLPNWQQQAARFAQVLEGTP